MYDQKAISMGGKRVSWGHGTRPPLCTFHVSEHVRYRYSFQTDDDRVNSPCSQHQQLTSASVVCFPKISSLIFDKWHAQSFNHFWTLCAITQKWFASALKKNNANFMTSNDSQLAKDSNTIVSTDKLQFCEHSWRDWRPKNDKSNQTVPHKQCSKFVNC